MSNKTSNLQRTWKITWFVSNCNGKGIKTKSVLKTVNCNDYVDKETEKQTIKEQAYLDNNLDYNKIVMIKEIKDELQ